MRYTSAMSSQASRRVARATLLALSFMGSSIALLACKETSVDAYVDGSAQDICDAVLACNCEYPNGALLEHCVAELTIDLDAQAQLNLVEGLSFDGDCADEALSAIKELACGVEVGDPDAACQAPCKLWHGPVGKGGTCTSINGSDNCGQGLVCGGDGACVDPCAEPKRPAIGEVCGPTLGCVEGAFCNTDSDLSPLCQALPQVGQPCTDDLQCADNLVCDSSDPGAFICAALPGLGEACPDLACTTGLYCDGTVCAALPTVGEPCPIGVCAPPYACNPANVCVDPPPQVCGYYGGLPLEDCAADQFTCSNGACIAQAQLCDGVPQCADASDEAPFNPGCNPGCTIDEFTCDDGTCVDQVAQCDNVANCPDGSDEAPANPLCV